MRIKRGIAAIVALMGSVLLALSGAVPALAHSGPSAGLSLPGGLRLAPTGSTTSTAFGGWIFAPKTATSVTTEFTVPPLTCTSTTSGLGPIAVMTTGTKSAPQFNAAGLLMECLSGAPEMEAVAEVGGTFQTGGTVAAGDLMRCTLILSAKGITARVEDLTAGHTFRVKASGPGAVALKEEIIDDSLVNTSTGSQLPVANFGKIEFTKARVGGQAIGSVPARTRVNMQNAQNQLQIRTGWPFPGNKGQPTNKDAFRTQWEHQ